MGQGRAWTGTSQRLSGMDRHCRTKFGESSSLREPSSWAKLSKFSPKVVVPASTSRLFSAAPSGAVTNAVAETTTQNLLFRIPVLGFFFKVIASFKLPSRSTTLNIILATLLARMWWKYSVPKWIKRNVYKVLPSQWVPAPQAVTGSDNAAPLPMEKGEDGGLVSLPALALKLGNLFNYFKEQLQTPLEGYALQGAVLATLQAMDTKDNAAEEWNTYYSSAGEPYEIADKTQLIDGLHLSDWGYLEETTQLRRYLQGLNFTLIRHVRTDEPGRVSHYVAMDPKEKLALIVVKGTSELGDLVTDACGVPARHNLTGSFADGAPLNISCHEGILEASLNLAEDVQPLVEELLVPAGYRIRLIGHSLGAASAIMTAVLLRSRLNQLDLDVWAYAPVPLLNYEAAVACREFCTSIVNNADIMPRASLANLRSLLRFLELVNRRLEEKGLSPTGPKTMISLWQALQKGNETSMTPTEVLDGLRETVSEDELQDMDHLFVPGKVLVMYRKHDATVPSRKEDKDDDDEEELEIFESAAITSDGACQLLRQISFDSTLLSDHFPDAYEKTMMTMTSCGVVVADPLDKGSVAESSVEGSVGEPPVDGVVAKGED